MLAGRTENHGPLYADAEDLGSDVINSIAGQIFDMTDDIAERVRKIGGATLGSIGDIARHQSLKDNDGQSVTPTDMLVELRADNQHLSRSLRSAHAICEEHNDVATASLIETWIDQTEPRAWFLSETVRDL